MQKHRQTSTRLGKESFYWWIISIIDSLLIEALMLLMLGFLWKNDMVMFWSFMDINICVFHVEKATLEALEFGYKQSAIELWYKDDFTQGRISSW